MATLRALVKSTLTSSASLTALLTGSIKDAQDLPLDGGGMTSAPKLADKVRIAPHGVIRWRNETAFSAETLGAENTSFEVYLYDDAGYTTIDSAIALIKALLHRLRFQVDDRQFVYINWLSNSGELTADEYQFAPVRFMRFQVITVR